MVVTVNYDIGVLLSNWANIPNVFNVRKIYIVFITYKISNKILILVFLYFSKAFLVSFSFLSTIILYVNLVFSRIVIKETQTKWCRRQTSK